MKQQKQLNKKAKILMSTLIPIGTIGIASAITLPLVLKNNPEDQGNTYELKYDDGYGYICRFSKLTPGGTYKFIVNLDGHEGNKFCFNDGYGVTNSIADASVTFNGEPYTDFTIGGTEQYIKLNNWTETSGELIIEVILENDIGQDIVEARLNYEG